jgi:hypothetical protein
MLLIGSILLLESLIFINSGSSQELHRQKRCKIVDKSWTILCLIQNIVWGFGGNPGFGGIGGGFGSGFGSDSFNAYNPIPHISDCPTNDGNRTGICVRSTAECTSRGGRPLGACYATPQSGTNIQGIKYYPEINS